MTDLKKREGTANLRVREFDPIPSPAELWEKIPISPQAQKSVEAGRQAIRRCLTGEDERLMAIVGPCSIHSEDLAFEYAAQLKDLSDRVAQKILVVMRVYFEKPRTTVGWKGLINDPHLNGSYDIPHGIEKARRILHEIAKLGLPCATEFLDPIIPQYTAGLVSWAAIGARTTESQTHREMVSGLSMPVGFKNSTDGSMDNAINAMISARTAHSFLGINEHGMTSVVRTAGNPDVHIVLRGGNNGPNYDKQSVQEAYQKLTPHLNGKKRLLLIDCSHGNSNKDYRKQGAVFNAVYQQWAEGNKAILGCMIESHLVAGNQPLSDRLVHGQSITDGCISMAETRLLLENATQAKA